MKKLTIKEQTYLYLKEKIISGELKQGDRINIEQLSGQLDISNSPIREAISMLNKEGLVNFDGSYGIKVVELSETDLEEITDAIKILIIGGYKLCIEKSCLKELEAEMELCLRKQEECLKTGNERGFLEYSIKFDECLVTVSKNKKLTAILGNLNDLFYLVVKNYHRTNVNKKASLTEHKEILRAIKAGRSSEVEKLLNEHYKNSLTIIIKNRNS